MSRIRAYSMLTRRLVTRAYSQAASTTSVTLHRLFTGTISLRRSSSGACRETARVTGSPSPARRPICGTRPTVDTVIPRALIPKPPGTGAIRVRMVPSTAL